MSHITKILIFYIKKKNIFKKNVKIYKKNIFLKIKIFNKKKLIRKLKFTLQYIKLLKKY